MRRTTQPAPVAELPPPTPTATLAGAAQLGRGGGSGNVELWNILQRGPANQQMLVEDIGQRVVVTSTQIEPPRIPDSLFTDRAVRGGVRSSAAPAEFQENRPNLGGHVVMANRPPQVLLQVDTQQQPAQWVSPAEWREAPPVTNLCRRGAENLPTSAGFAGKAGV